MAGHSRWAQVKYKKALSDAKRGQLFSKLVREITVAARLGGHDPEVNPRLRAAMERAKSLGFPKENIERALERASGKSETESLQEFLYEVVWPGGVYILIEGITDNKNRTLAEIKQVLTKHGAKLAAPGSLLWNFEKVWDNEGKDYRPHHTLELPAEERKKLEELLDILLERGDVQEVYTNLKEG